MDSSNKNMSAAGLLRQRRLLQSENLTLQTVVDMKAQRLKHITEENQRLQTLLRQQMVRATAILQEIQSLTITDDSPSTEQN